MLELNVSNFIEKQFPQIYREEGPFFVEFVKQYYKWLETDETSPVYQARNYLKHHDVDTTVDDFIVYFKEKYLKNIQLNTATNTKQLIKNSIDLYRSKGTENAIHLFFDLIFSTPSEVYYPGNDVFRLSDAEWRIPRYVEVSSKPVNRLMVGRAIVGVDSGARAFVEKLVRRKINNHFIEVFYISAIDGEFQTGEIITLSDRDEELAEFPVMLGSLNEVDIIDGGSDFNVGEVVKLTSKTGAQGRGLVQKLETLTGIVDFTLIDGGWGYTSSANVQTSNTVIQLSNVHIESTSNTSLAGKIKVVSQYAANVQWYDNTAFFAVGDTVYNYYANGDLIGENVIMSAEYGTSNTTNYFLLSNISGVNAIDDAAKTYYTAGNTASFQVQNAGWVDVTASGTLCGISSNVFIKCVGNSANFKVGDNVYQISTNNHVYASSIVQRIDNTSANTFTIKINEIDGLFLTNQKLKVAGSAEEADIDSLSLDIGLINTSGTFKILPYNRVRDTGNGSLSYGKVDLVPFGSGASVGIDDDLVNTETVSLNLNYLRDHSNNALARNQLNATSYGASLNDANSTNMVLADALDFQSLTIGTIARLELANPGSDYSYAPFVVATDPLVAPLAKFDFILRFANTTGIFAVGETVTQAENGARGLVKFANTSEMHVRRLTYSDRWEVGATNNHIVIGEQSGHNAYLSEVTYDIDGVAGKNAKILTEVTTSDSSITQLKVSDSGFNFIDGQSVTISSLDGSHSATGLAKVETSGFASGYYTTGASFLSSNKYLYDGDYYQDFSYEIKSPITIARYADMLKNVLHVAGTKAFSSILKTSLLVSTGSVNDSTVPTVNNAPSNVKGDGTDVEIGL